MFSHCVRLLVHARAFGDRKLGGCTLTHLTVPRVLTVKFRNYDCRFLGNFFPLKKRKGCQSTWRLPFPFEARHGLWEGRGAGSAVG